MIRYTVSVWETPGLNEALRACAAPGIYSAAELAYELSQRFHVEISRNAIMGKCWREGIPLRGRKGPEPKPKVSSPPRPRGLLPKRISVARIAKSNPLEPDPRGDVDDGCRWMHGDADARNFCGAPTVRFGISWCPHHCTRVWNATTAEQVRRFNRFVTWRAA